MISINKKSQKILSGILIVVILTPSILFSKPKKAEALIPDFLNAALNAIGNAFNSNTSVQSTTQTGFDIKDFAERIGKQVLSTIAKRFLQEMTKSTINWINSGFHGNPLFLENPQSFFKDIAKYEVKNLVDMFGYDSRRFPFGKNFALNTIDAYKSQLEINAEYTLSRVINDPALLQQYRTDFNVGGWNGFLINTQYPQNNHIGFQMLATEELARRLDGTTQNAAQKVQTTLQQGMGFLSPKTCPSNPQYNNLKNEFQQPGFKPPAWNFEPTVEAIINQTEENPEGERNPEYDRQLANYTRQHAEFTAAERAAWARTSTCPGGLVATTPGSVVASQITNAMGSQFRTTELAIAMDKSISAITDALLNKFLNDGLSALASTVNPAPPQDDWSYLGNTLGSPVGGANTAWDSGPDEVVVLSNFRTTVEDGINSTNTELLLMDNASSTNPGITQLLGQIWPKARELDICIPGPNIGWEKRADNERERNALKLQEKSADDDPEEAARAQLTYNELKFAVDFFKDWTINKMMTELPNSIIYLDAVDEIRDLSQESNELTDKRRVKNQALARLQAIRTALATFTTQPAPGTSQERVLVSLKKQYNATSNTVSNTFTIENTRNELAIAKEKLIKLNGLVTQCGAERATLGWTQTNENTPSGTSTFRDQGTEQNIFCDFPIKGGYDHDSFRHANDGGEGPGRVTHPAVPYVNANEVFTFDQAFGSGETDIEMSCNIIYRANLLDYKGNLPGITGVTEQYVELPNESGNGGGSGGGGGDDGGGNVGTGTPDFNCTPGDQVVDLGAPVNIRVFGGSGSNNARWSAPGGNPSSGSGSSFRTSYSRSDGYTVTATSGDRAAQCQVRVSAS